MAAFIRLSALVILTITLRGGITARSYGRDQTHEFVTIKEAAKILGVSLNTLRNWHRDGKMRVSRNPISGYPSPCVCPPTHTKELIYPIQQFIALPITRGNICTGTYSRKVGYFLQVLDFEPRVLDGRGQRRPPSEFKELTFADRLSANLVLCCLNSNLFYWFVTVFSDCRHVNKREVDAFPIDLARLAAGRQSAELSTLASDLMTDSKSNSQERTMRFRHDTFTVQCIVPKESKRIIDSIDRSLAAHFGFTDEELDFILNYDIKHRMGQDESDDEE